MKQAVWITLLISGCFASTTVLVAQTNSYIATTDGFWDEARLWSLAAPPSITQSGIFITNAASVNVTIDSITASEFPETLTITNLSINPQENGSTVYLDNTGTITLQGFQYAPNTSPSNLGVFTSWNGTALLAQGGSGGPVFPTSGTGVLWVNGIEYGPTGAIWGGGLSLSTFGANNNFASSGMGQSTNLNDYGGVLNTNFLRNTMSQVRMMKVYEVPGPEAIAFESVFVNGGVVNVLLK